LWRIGGGALTLPFPQQTLKIEAVYKSLIPCCLVFVKNFFSLALSTPKLAKMKNSNLSLNFGGDPKQTVIH